MNFTVTKFYTILLACLSAPLALLAKDSNAVQKQGFHKPFVFVENKGQVIDQHQKGRNDVEYSLSGNGLNVFVGHNTLHYQFDKKETSRRGKQSIHTYRLDVNLVNANQNAVATAEDGQRYFENYHTAILNGKTVTVHSYNRIVYHDVYPGIDWAIYVKDNKMEYDFIVHPNGNADDIQVNYEGAKNIAQKADGSIVLTTPMGDITEHSPYAYDPATGTEIASSFKYHNNALSFEVAPHTGTVVIDPSVTWATYYGGTGSDQINGTTIDKTGAIYVVGTSSSISGLTTSGAHQTTLGGGFGDVFVAKFTSAGNLEWGTYYGGSGYDAGADIAVDDSAYVYVTGQTASTSAIATTGAFQTTFGGGGGFGNPGDAFLAKFDSSGTLKWGTYYGGTGNDGGNGIAIGKAGFIYFGGIASSTSKIASSNGYDTTMNGTSDMFLAKFKPNGTRVWATYYGGASQDQLEKIAVDQYGGVYSVGHTFSTSGIATAGGWQTSAGGGTTPNTAFLVKFDTACRLHWGTYYGYNVTQGYSIGIDSLNAIYIAGYTASTTGIASANVYQTSIGGGDDLFLAKFDTSGNRIWGTYAGGTQNDINYGGIIFDILNNVSITGHSSSTTGIATANTNSFQTNYNGNRDAIVMKFTPIGQLLDGTYYGSSGDDEGTCLAYNKSDGSVVMGGFTTSNAGVTTPLGYDTSYGGGSFGGGDGLLVKFNQDTVVVINQPYRDTLLCPGSTFNVAYSTSYSFFSGNTFSVQLSNATGSFTAPTLIGTSTATTSGTVACTIPAATPTGTGYRIRVTANSPNFVSPDDYYNIQIVNNVPTSPTATSNSPVCVGDTIKLSGKSLAPDPITYTWTGPGAYNASGKNVFRTNATAGMAGTYTLSASHSGCPANTTTVNVVVNSVYPATPTATTNGPICQGATLLLFSSTATSGVTYSWIGPGGYTSASQNPVITSATIANSGTYTIAVNLNGCKATNSVFAEVDAPSTPVITITANPSDTLCAGQNASFSSSILYGGSSPNYQWFVDNVAEIGAGSSVWSSPYLTSGSVVYCILTSNAGCITSPVDTSNKITITIEPVTPPIVGIVAYPGPDAPPGTAITFKAIVVNGGTTPTYQWRVNGTNIPGATGRTYTSSILKTHDIVSVEVHGNGKCASPDSAQGYIRLALGIAELATGMDISLYPNPNTGNFNLKGTFDGITEQTATIEILNMVGQAVYTDVATIDNGMVQKQISLANNIPNGMYLMRVRVGEQNNIIRFSVQR
ncbi:MAG: T9SS type A sorting domain-containing protein [Taibaiella sp.]|nr:T9SS type A sorting domain-containing protein [Taibaiella sp.]